MGKNGQDSEFGQCHLQCAIKAYFLLTNCEDLEQTEASATSAENCATILHAFNCTLVTISQVISLVTLILHAIRLLGPQL